MRDFAAWCRCKASETDGEGSVLKYMTQARESKATQQMRCYANVLFIETNICFLFAPVATERPHIIHCNSWLRPRVSFINQQPAARVAA